MIDVSRTYDMGTFTVMALDGIDLSVSRGEFVAVVGPSGSGKSTLLNLIGGLDRPSGGRVRVLGSDLSNLSEEKMTRFRRENVGMVFQFFHLIPHISALDNIMISRMFEADCSVERALRLLDQLGLKDRMSHLPGELSGGEQQRVSLARALFNEPDILLADEPTGNVDTKMGSSIVKLLRDQKKWGRTIILVSHDMNVAREADRIVELKDGRVVPG